MTISSDAFLAQLSSLIPSAIASQLQPLSSTEQNLVRTKLAYHKWQTPRSALGGT
jgi:hypothetical protein